jgi:hypothetical protein
VSAREFVEWMLYDAQEGLPDRRADWHAGMLASVVANVNRKKGTRPLTPSDFMPRRDAPSRDTREDTAGQRLAAFVRSLEARAAPRT